MTERKIKARPRRRPDVSGLVADLQPKSPNRSPASPARRNGRSSVSRASKSSTARRRVHVTIGREVAAALRGRVVERLSTNTQVLIEAYEAGHAVEPAALGSSPFAPRSRPEGREGVYFYLAGSEVDYIDGLALRAGFATRSAHIDATLRVHLID